MLNFAPDLDEATPGVLTAATNLVPNYKGGYEPNVKATLASGGDSKVSLTTNFAGGAVVLTSLYATYRAVTSAGVTLYEGALYAATNSQIYFVRNVLIPPSWTNISRGGGYIPGTIATYADAGEVPSIGFDFCTYGRVVIACHKNIDYTQYSTMSTTPQAVSTTFADLSNAPSGMTCCVASNFVFIGNIKTYGAPSVTGASNMVAWSALGDHTTWGPAPTTNQSSYATFNDTPGAVTAVRRFNDGVVVYKAKAIYLGRYVGPGTNSPIWDFTRISDSVGCIGNKSIVDIGNAHVFVGQDDIYLFDGTRPRSITQGVFETYFKGKLADAATYGPVYLGHDKPRKMVLVRQPSTSIDSVDTLTWNYDLNKWGRISDSTGADNYDIPINLAPIIFCQAEIDAGTGIGATTSSTFSYLNTYADFSHMYSMFGVTASDAGGRLARIYERASGVPATSSCVTGSYGDDVNVTYFNRVVPRWQNIPDSATLSCFYKASFGESWSSVYATTMNSRYRFDLTDATDGSTNLKTANNWMKFGLSWVNTNSTGKLLDIKVLGKVEGTK